MRAVVQRVSRAAVRTGGQQIAAIGPGLLVLLAIGVGDEEDNARWMAEKVRSLRIFKDAEGRMNEPLGDREILCVSQFTLYGQIRKGNRPSFTAAAPPDLAEPVYQRFCEIAKAAHGRFGERMEVELVNDGPVTLMLET